MVNSFASFGLFPIKNARHLLLTHTAMGFWPDWVRLTAIFKHRVEQRCKTMSASTDFNTIRRIAILTQ